MMARLSDNELCARELSQINSEWAKQSRSEVDSTNHKAFFVKR